MKPKGRKSISKIDIPKTALNELTQLLDIYNSTDDDRLDKVEAYGENINNDTK